MPQLAIPVAAEAAVATTLTAAEIAAAEAAAAAAAEAAATAAATEAATAAAAEAATTAAAEAAAQQAAQQAAAQQASTSGIQTLAQEVGVNAPPTGIETLAQQPMANPANEQVLQAFQNAQANNVPMSGQEFLNNSFAGPATSMPVTAPSAPVSQLPPFDATQYLNATMSGGAPPVPPVDPLAAAAAAPVEPLAAASAEAAAAAPASSPQLYGSSTQLPTYGTEAVGPNTLPDITAQAPLGSSAERQALFGNTEGAYGLEGYDNRFNPLAAPEPATGLEGLLDKAVDYVKKNPISSGLGAMSAYNMLNKPKTEEKPKYKSTFNASAYRGYEPTPPTPYTPQYPQYARGGLADLGGYSDGGRMLKGPGDGMSDDIPATIANKQPARLANEEFVIPADVVSHLGNGSSEAGAKQLYKMMDRVRKARTGNKKQGKQINPEKYLA
jgi:hypothetical protein